MTSPKVVWSYSSKKSFETCPHRYFRERVAKDVKSEQGEAAIYGTDLHAAAEFYVRDGTPLPEKFAFLQPTMDMVTSWPGEKHCELKLGLTEDLHPCDFFGKNVWWRGVADLVVMSPCGTKARLIDYKTGKNSKYVDMEQLDLLSAALFLHYPKLTTIRAGLLFVILNEMVPQKPKEYTFMTQRSAWVEPRHTIKRIEVALDTGVWNKNKTGLCKNYCPVFDCEHNGRKG